MTCAVVGSLAVRGVTFLDVPLVTRETVKGVQVRQRTKPACSAKQLHRPRAVMAARSYGRGRIGVAHDTISSSPLGCGARVLPWSGRELNFWQCFVALGNCTGNHGSVSWLPTIKCAGGALWVLAIHLRYSPAQTARHFINASKSKLGLRRLTMS